MSIMTKALPGLYGGISQQHPHARLETQCEEALNCIGTIVDGLKLKRPQSKWNYRTADWGPSVGSIFVHPMELAGGNFVLTVTSDADIHIVNLDTMTKCTLVNAPADVDALTYITSSGDPATKLRALTISDTTFILNRDVTVGHTTTTSSYATNLAIVEFKYGVASITYMIELSITLPGAATPTKDEIKINGGTYLTTGSVDAAASAAALEPYLEAIGFDTTRTGAACFISFAGDKVLHGGKTYQCIKSTVGVLDAMTTPGTGTSWATYWEEITAGSVAAPAWGSGTNYYTGTAGTVPVDYEIGVQTKDGYGNQMLKGYSTKYRHPDTSLTSGTFVTVVQKYADLPRVGLATGHIYEIMGESSNSSGYYVEYDPQLNLYVEATLPYYDYSLDPVTMPVLLIYNGSNTFTLRLANSTDEWTENGRTVGDTDSNPDPSFVGNTISDLFLFKNRLGFISNENVCLSKSGDYFDFYASTVTEVLDDSPIDATVDTNVDVNLWAAVPFEDSMMLFGKSQQFIISSGNQPLTPKTIFMTPATSFNSMTTAHPILSGPNAYFIEPNGDYSILREYFVVPDTVTYDAALLTKHVPKFLPATIRDIIGFTNQEMIMVAPRYTPYLYVYKYQWEGNDRIQSAWFKWQLYFTINAIFRISEKLYLIDSNGNLLSINVNGDDQLSTAFHYHLDYARDMSATYDSITYDATTGRSTINTSWFDQSATTVIAALAQAKTIVSIVEDSTGVALDIKSVTANPASGYDIVVEGQITDITDYVMGINFASSYILSELTARDQNGVAYANTNMTIMSWFFEFKETGEFTVKVSPKRRSQKSKTFNFFELDESNTDNLLLALKDSSDTGHKFKCMVFANAAGATLTVYSYSYLPANITQMAFEIEVTKN